MNVLKLGGCVKQQDETNLKTVKIIKIYPEPSAAVCSFNKKQLGLLVDVSTGRDSPFQLKTSSPQVDGGESVSRVVKA